MANDDYTIEFDQGNNTNIAFGTTADYAYTMWLAKKKQIDDLEFECELLVEKYHAEMRRARIPMHLRENLIEDLFDKDKKKRGFARKFFLEKSFTEGFLKKHKVEFVKKVLHGYGRTAVGLDLRIGDYTYTVEIPIPENIVSEVDKKRLIGQVEFRADRLHKSKKDDFIRELEPVQMPTYDWKKCFEAIEAIVEKEGSKNG